MNFDKIIVLKKFGKSDIYANILLKIYKISVIL